VFVQRDQQEKKFDPNKIHFEQQKTVIAQLSTYGARHLRLFGPVQIRLSLTVDG